MKVVRVGTLTIRVSDAERAAIEAAALAMGLTASSWLRMIAMQAARDQAARIGT